MTKRIPVGIKINLRNYKRYTQNLEKPFCEDFSEIMSQAALYAISQIPSAVFCYCFSDEIIVILRNDKTQDQEAWHNNNIQKITSSISSLITIGFYKSKEIFGQNLDLVGDAIFGVKTFTLPSLDEVTNYLIWKQSYCMGAAAHEASSYEFENKFGKYKAQDLIEEASYKDKIAMLLQYCGIDFYDLYLPSFIYGVAIYKIPVIVHSRDGDTSRNKWHIDLNVPNIIHNRDFISAILANGADVFRASDLNIDI